MKDLLQKIIEFIKSKFQNIFEIFRLNSEVAVKVTNTLKSIVESPIVDFVTDLIPGDLDDKIHEKLKVVIPIVAQKIAITHGILSINDRNTDAISAIIEHLKNEVNPGLKISFWIMFAGELNIALSDGKITLSEAIALSQIIYAESKKK
jgi:hypothetical protein